MSLLVTSVGQLIEARDRVRLYWVHSCWIALTFVGHVVSWFTIWRFQEHGAVACAGRHCCCSQCRY
ncbi:MAG: hypothetical protein IPF50_12300 [Proteobacteria bacterium]|nr:hypothetical protein [Pseudomonadota bacterium]